MPVYKTHQTGIRYHHNTVAKNRVVPLFPVGSYMAYRTPGMVLRAGCHPAKIVLALSQPQCRRWHFCLPLRRPPAWSSLWGVLSLVEVVGGLGSRKPQVLEVGLVGTFVAGARGVLVPPPFYAVVG